MIISASRRTDIPCFYAERFINRLHAGSVLTRNPMNHAQLSRIPLAPEVVDCIVFWTKNPRNIMPHLKTLDKMGYFYYFQFTLTPYDDTIELNLGRKSAIENTFIELSQTIGKERVLWRYDPIILNDQITISYHQEQFARLCDKLHSYTESVTISFVDAYPKLKTKLIREITKVEIAELSGIIGQIAKSYGLTVKACCEQFDLAAYGIDKASCIDKVIIEKICGCPTSLVVTKNQRPSCGCMESIDIGAYNTCMNGCIYCYANSSVTAAQRRYGSHSVDNELLVGTVGEGEVIRMRKVKSVKKGQLNLFV